MKINKITLIFITISLVELTIICLSGINLKQLKSNFIERPALTILLSTLPIMISIMALAISFYYSKKNYSINHSEFILDNEQKLRDIIEMYVTHFEKIVNLQPIENERFFQKQSEEINFKEAYHVHRIQPFLETQYLDDEQKFDYLVKKLSLQNTQKIKNQLAKLNKEIYFLNQLLKKNSRSWILIEEIKYLNNINQEAKNLITELKNIKINYKNV